MVRASWLCEICSITAHGVKLLPHLPFLDFLTLLPSKTSLLEGMILKFTQNKERLKAENKLCLNLCIH